jgi:hypothetical protein
VSYLFKYYKKERNMGKRKAGDKVTKGIKERMKGEEEW